MRSNKGIIVTLFFSFMFLISCNEKVASESDTNEQSSQTGKRDTTSSSPDHLLMYFEGLHPKDQQKVFVGLPPEMKHALWTSHWKKHLDAAENEEERNFIISLINQLKVDYYRDSNLYIKEGRPYFDGLDRNMFTVFKNDTNRVLDLLYRIGGDMKTPRLAADAGRPDCECNIRKDWCIPGWTCGPADCKFDWWGCGKAFLESCNGLCLFNES